MTKAPPILTDRAALSAHRARTTNADPGAMFMRKLAIDEVQERLTMVNRAFTAPAIVTPFPHLWGEMLPNALCAPDEDRLALSPGAHDLIIHDLCLHWANDPVGQLVQCRRALKPDGMLLATLFGGQTLAELRAVLASAEATLTGGLAARVAPMAEIRDLGGLLQRAGLALPVADALPQTATYADLTALMHDLRAMGENNALNHRHRHPTPRALFALADTLYRETYETEDGRLPATFELISLSGWAPHPDQQKPLRPGSASHSLAKALDDLKMPPKD